MACCALLLCCQIGEPQPHIALLQVVPQTTKEKNAVNCKLASTDEVSSWTIWFEHKLQALPAWNMASLPPACQHPTTAASTRARPSHRTRARPSLPCRPAWDPAPQHQLQVALPYAAGWSLLGKREAIDIQNRRTTYQKAAVWIWTCVPSRRDPPISFILLVLAVGDLSTNTWCQPA